MALVLQKVMLRAFVQSMYNEGIINDQYYQVQALKESIRPDYVLRTVTCYCISAQSLLSNLTTQINKENVDFCSIHAYATNLFEKTSGIGAEKVKRNCAELIRASEEHDKDCCLRALNGAKNEFSQLKRNFETLLQIERRIIDLERMQ